jgi:hypothetical protein
MTLLSHDWPSHDEVTCPFIFKLVLVHSITHRPGSGAQTTWKTYIYL